MSLCFYLPSRGIKWASTITRPFENDAVGNVRLQKALEIWVQIFSLALWCDPLLATSMREEPNQKQRSHELEREMERFRKYYFFWRPPTCRKILILVSKIMVAWLGWKDVRIRWTGFLLLLHDCHRERFLSSTSLSSQQRLLAALTAAPPFPFSQTTKRSSNQSPVPLPWPPRETSRFLLFPFTYYLVILLTPKVFRPSAVTILE